MSVPVLVLIHDEGWRSRVLQHLQAAGLGAVAATDVSALLALVARSDDHLVCVLDNDSRGDGRRAFAELLRTGKGAVPVVFTLVDAKDGEAAQRLLLAGALAVVAQQLDALPDLMRQLLRAIDLKYWRYEESQPWSALAVSKLNRIRDLVMYESFRARASGDVRSLHILNDIDIALEAVLALDHFSPWQAIMTVDRYEGTLMGWGRLAILLANGLGLQLPAKQDVMPYLQRCFPSREYACLADIEATSGPQGW